MTGRGRPGRADVRNAVAAHMPGYQVQSVVQAGEGLDNLAYEVNGELIVRFSKEPDPARRTALLNREARLLAAVADVSPLPVPVPAFTAAEQGYLAYVKLPGVPLLDVSRHQRLDHGASIAATLGELLTDFGLLYRDLGRAALRAAIHHYRTGGNDVAALSERAVFYARCSVFEDLAYGIQTGRDKYTDKCLAAMEWLFPA